MVDTREHPVVNASEQKHVENVEKHIEHLERKLGVVNTVYFIIYISLFLIFFISAYSVFANPEYEMNSTVALLGSLWAAIFIASIPMFPIGIFLWRMRRGLLGPLERQREEYWFRRSQELLSKDGHS